MRVVGLGAGGHAKVVLEILRLLDGYECVGLLDANTELHGTQVLGFDVIGDDALMAEFYEQGTRCAFVGVGTIGNPGARIRVYEEAKRLGFEFARAIHPQAIVSPSAEIGDGPTVMAGAVINAAALIGDNVIINTGAVVEHDCIIGSHAHVATGARLASSVRVGNAAHIGIGASIKQGLNIGENAVVGAGAAVIEDVRAGTTVGGVPARVLKGGRLNG